MRINRIVLLCIILLLLSNSKTSNAQVCNFSQIPANLRQGLVAYYPFCGNANDMSGNGNNGTVSGASLTTDRFGALNSAYNFNGTNNYIYVPSSSSISIQNNFSISVWFIMNGGGCNPRIFEVNQNLNSCGGYMFAVNGTSNVSRTIHVARFGSCDTSISFNSTQSIPSLQWNHLVMSVDGVNGVGKLYLNGQLIQTVSGAQIPIFSYNGNPLTIGNINSGRCDWWGGKIDDLFFYNRALSSCEVEELYNATATEIPPLLSNERYPAENAIINQPHQLNARLITRARYLWLPSTGLSSDTIINPVFTYNREQEYRIRITTQAGCELIDTLLVRIYTGPNIFVPEGFSPNGDGVNDVLRPRLVGIRRLIHFKIFNRWGQLIYETNEEGMGWDGIYQGIKQPLETYVWMIQAEDVQGNIIKRTGSTLLLR